MRMVFSSNSARVTPARPIGRAALSKLLLTLRGGALLLMALLLAALALAFGHRLIGWSSFIVYSGSMTPKIAVGSVAVAKPVSVESLRIGDVIVYRAPGNGGIPTAHRI